ncbi:DUF4381 domain-containing protein [Aliikangiella maris]|uniref:DUF4381 domain-containing protein n=2 Tax=Aliikangiella maris TaxID=3162458 RepID=A0ABV3MKU3_9GAMM
MSQQANPLDQLRDIHLPAAVDPWQLAPGWWIIISLIIIGLIMAITKLIRKRRQLNRYLKPAAIELEQLAALPAENLSVIKVSELIKRVCLVFYPAEKIALLNGKDWVTFINQQTGSAVFDEQIERLFSQVIYQPQQPIDGKLWQKTIQQSRQVIEHIIYQSLRRKKGQQHA